MLNLVRANLYRLAHSRSVFVVLAVLLLTIVLSFQYLEQWAACASAADVFRRAALLEMTVVLVSIWFAGSFGSDIQEGTIANLLVGRKSRIAYVFAAMTSMFVAALALLVFGAAISLGLYGVFGSTPVEVDGLALVCWLLLGSLLTTAFAAVPFAVMLLGRRNAMALGIVVAILFGSGLLWLGASVAASWLSSNPAGLVLFDLLPFTLTTIRSAFNAGAPYQWWWVPYALAVVAASSALGCAILSRKEVG